MKKVFLLLSISMLTWYNTASAQTTITVMENIIFYDGYAGRVDSPAAPAGVIRHRNDLYAKKLTDAEILSIGTSLQIKVTIKALCDNYDRIGNVFMAFVPKNATTYIPDSVKRIELGRFITPFMDKNKKPDTVPYIFDINNVAMLLKDTSITNNFAIWIELSEFGVPYAANNEIAGCSGRNDVCIGKLEFYTNSEVANINNDVLLPLIFNSNLNNYQEGATDQIGQTIRKITFTVSKNLTDASFYLITSNHGANNGGEEYNRRFHYVYYNDSLVLEYKPGRKSCEPFRKYNTQANGIYGPSARTNSQWQSFSNWCPGDVIDIRQINLGPIKAGEHTFQIEVPDAVFRDAQGYIPLSLYFQGKTSGVLGIKNNQMQEIAVSVYPNPTKGQFSVELPANGAELIVTDLIGKQILKTKTTDRKINLNIENEGVYIINVITKQGASAQKIIINR